MTPSHEIAVACALTHTFLKSLACAAVIWSEEFFELRFEVWMSDAIALVINIPPRASTERI